MTQIDDLVEALSDLEHRQWVERSQELAKKENLSPERIERWKPFWVPYAELSQETKDFDRVWARRAVEIFFKWMEKHDE